MLVHGGVIISPMKIAMVERMTYDPDIGSGYDTCVVKANSIVLLCTNLTSSFNGISHLPVSECRLLFVIGVHGSSFSSTFIGLLKLGT